MSVLKPGNDFLGLNFRECLQDEFTFSIQLKKVGLKSIFADDVSLALINLAMSL